MGLRRWGPKEAIVPFVIDAGSVIAGSRVLKIPEPTLRAKLEREGWLEECKEYWAREANQPPTAVVEGDEATIVADGDVDLGDLTKLIRDRGLNPDEWTLLASRLNQWEALAPEGEVITLHQTRITLGRKAVMRLVSPATHVPKLVKPGKRKRSTTKPQTIVVEGDHQAPYHDPELDRATTALVADLQPDEHIFLGDTMDLPTISRFTDHPAAMASVQDCIDEGYAILRRRAEAAPNAVRKKLKGNHDHRLEGELLMRAERMVGIRPAGEDLPALSLRRLLHLDTLGVELVEDPRGWEHARVEIVPGRDGLEVRHGFLTGANTATKTLDKIGRSAIVGHIHSKDHRWRLDYPEKVLRQVAVAGTMSRIDEVFPHFTQEPNWHQGFVTVTRWPNGQFHIEHATWSEGALYWRDRRY